MTIIEDVSRVDQLINTLHILDSSHLEIGIFGDGTMHMNGADTVLTIAITHEFGLAVKGIPERSFIRAGFDEYQEDIISQAEELLKQVISLKIEPEYFFNGLGHIVVGFIQRYLTDLSTPPNAPYTIKMKGSSNPLIDSGQLRDSITFKVVS